MTTALAELATLEQVARTAQARIGRLEKIGANLTEDLDDLAARSIASWLRPEDRPKADLCGFSEKMAGCGQDTLRRSAGPSPRQRARRGGSGPRG